MRYVAGKTDQMPATIWPTNAKPQDMGHQGMWRDRGQADQCELWVYLIERPVKPVCLTYQNAAVPMLGTYAGQPRGHQQLNDGNAAALTADARAQGSAVASVPLALHPAEHGQVQIQAPGAQDRPRARAWTWARRTSAGAGDTARAEAGAGARVEEQFGHGHGLGQGLRYRLRYSTGYTGMGNGVEVQYGHGHGMGIGMGMGWGMGWGRG